MRDKELFMNVDQLGDLYIYDVLLSYIYPRVFVCQDVYECKYLFYEMDSADDKDVWLVSKITKKEYYSLIDRKKAIQKAYDKKNSFELFSITKTYGNEERTNLVMDGKSWISHLPKQPVYAEKELLDDVTDQTLVAARETGSTTLDIRLFPGTDRRSVPQNVLKNLCASITTMTGAIFGEKRAETLRVATASGSCIVRFSFPEQINLFNENNSINEMSILNDVLSSESAVNGLKSVKDQKRFIRSYSSLLDTIRKTNSDVQFTTASPNSSHVRKIELTRDIIKNRFDDIKDIYQVETEESLICGQLIALDVKTRKFKFQTDEGDIVAGLVDPKILKSGSFEIPKVYNATICAEKYIDGKGIQGKEKYYLLDLK